MFGASRYRGFPRLGVVMISVAAGMSHASPAEAQWTLGPPELSLSEATGAPPFENIVSVVVRDDRIYASDAGSREIHMFDVATGEHLATTGGLGDGPGQFRGSVWIGNCGGDSILASDDALLRVSVYSRALEHLRTYRVESAADRLVSNIQCGGSSLLAISQLPDPQLSRTGPIPTIGTTYRSAFAVALYEPDGSHRHSIGRFPGGERYRSPSRTRDRYNDLPLLWGKHPVLGSAEWGFVLGTNDDWSLVRYDFDGNALDTLRLAESPRTVLDSHRAAYVQRRVQRSEDAGRPTAPTRQYWEEYPYPSLFPAYSKALAQPDGSVWVEGFAAPYLGDIAQWKVFAPDGILAATLNTVERFQILWVGETHVAGVMLDDLDVQTVEVRRILRR